MSWRAGDAIKEGPVQVPLGVRITESITGSLHGVQGQGTSVLRAPRSEGEDPFPC